ncbi:MAG: ATP-binding protein [Chitinispirillia bacterium]|nr:ATP-binding protein [Chitinispirillia bacterium]
MINKFKLIHAALALALLFAALLVCRESIAQYRGEPSLFMSYREIPGVTAEEIEAITRLKEQHSEFVYGMIPSTEFFEDCRSGEAKGYATMFANWLTDLFGTPFNLERHEWSDLVQGLEEGSIHFTGDMTLTNERREKYFMSDPIARRTLRYFKLYESLHPLVITSTRTPRFAFIEGAATYNYVVNSGVYDTLEAFFVKNTAEAYELLKSEKVDAFLEESITEAAFDIYGDIISVNFFPLLYNPVTLTAFKPEFEPVISVINKALQSGEARRLADIYKYGEAEYRRHKFCMALNEEERAYIRDNPVIPYAAEHYNYPVAFYNKYDKEWQGIFFDVLSRVTDLTGLSFRRINDKYTEWPDLFGLIERGDAFLIAELIPTEERRSMGFLWPKVPTTEDKYALLSRSETPNATLNEILGVKVGLTRGTAYSEVFHSWFPNHPHTVDFESSDEAFDALNRGEVDMVMSSQRRLLAITNYHEFSGYKANLIFDRTAESYIGFNRDQAVLSGIFTKALMTMDVKSISEQWELKTYDYKGKIAQAQRPWLIGISFVLLCMLFILWRIKSSEGRRLEVLVQKRTIEAETANRAKSAFLANMSHEIRTPLNAIIGMTAICKNTSDIRQKDHAIDKIENASGHLLGLVNDVLDMSKIEANRLELSPVEFDFEKMMRKITSVINFRVDEKRQKLHIKIDDNIPRLLMGDDQRLAQVIMNLLSNAVKFTPEGGEISFNAALLRETAGICELRIEVTDNGIGISAGQQMLLFNAFGQADSGTSRKFGGTGLGLTISKRIIELMGGSVWVESELGKGARFIFTAKVQRSEPRVSADGAPNNTHNLQEGEFASKRLLLVEDIETNRYVILTLLKPSGITIDCADNGKAALEKISADPNYDMVLMDLEMPEMDGYEATRRIRALPEPKGKKLPIIAMTANVFKEDIDACLAAGMDDHIGKPLDISDLFGKLRKYLV